MPHTQIQAEAGTKGESVWIIFKRITTNFCFDSVSVGVAVSADFALASLLGPGESPSSLVGKEYSCKDFGASPNRVLCQGYPNLFSLAPKIGPIRKAGRIDIASTLQSL
jgi:hypothetical protein